jgi:hypothetical protein
VERKSIVRLPILAFHSPPVIPTLPRHFLTRASCAFLHPHRGVVPLPRHVREPPIALFARKLQIVGRCRHLTRTRRTPRASDLPRAIGNPGVPLPLARPAPPRHLHTRAGCHVLHPLREVVPLPQQVLDIPLALLARKL